MIIVGTCLNACLFFSKSLEHRPYLIRDDGSIYTYTDFNLFDLTKHYPKEKWTVLHE